MAYLIEANEHFNEAEPQIMHIDLNSCFATIEQQANPLLRNKPIAVAAYTSPGGCVLAPSYEAKAYGVKTGMTVRMAKQLCPSIHVMMPDPDKYFYVNTRLYKLLYDYTSEIDPLSIDEFVINFSTSRKIHSRSLAVIAREIKHRIRTEIGDWMRVNIGLGTNRFLAKTAASLHKPNGFDVIHSQNILKVYSSLKLTDLCGIAARNEIRLNNYGIFSPLQFIAAPKELLHKQVFKSIEGLRWFSRLRGWEVDDRTFGRKTFGNDFALYLPSYDAIEIAQNLCKLSTKTGARLRKNNYYASGIHIWLLHDNYSYWHKSKKLGNILYSDQDIYRAAKLLVKPEYIKRGVRKMGLCVFDLHPTSPTQLELFDNEYTKQRKIAQTIDEINRKWGEFSVTSARMMNMENRIIKRVPFGATKDLKTIYEDGIANIKP